jgi:uncharacterized membrane protein
MKTLGIIAVAVIAAIVLAANQGVSAEKAGTAVGTALAWAVLHPVLPLAVIGVVVVVLLIRAHRERGIESATIAAKFPERPSALS